MDGKTYLASRLGLRKVAANPMSIVTEPLKTGATNIMEGASDAWALTIPLGGLLLAYLAHKATTPKAVSDNASAYAANAMERESLAESIRDLEDAKLRASFKRNRSKYHDQFV